MRYPHDADTSTASLSSLCSEKRVRDFSLGANYSQRVWRLSLKTDAAIDYLAQKASLTHRRIVMAFDPAEVGRKLIAVGEKQITTGKKFDLAAKESREVATALNDNGRVDRSLGSVENGTRSTRNLLTPVATALHTVANGLNSISVPSIEFDTRTIELAVIGRVRFVTGISVSSSRPFRSIGSSIEAVADDIDNIRTGLKDIADAVKDLQEELPNIKTRILNGSVEMEKGGDVLVEAGTIMKEAGTLLAS